MGLHCHSCIGMNGASVLLVSTGQFLFKCTQSCNGCISLFGVGFLIVTTMLENRDREPGHRITGSALKWN